MAYTNIDLFREVKVYISPNHRRPGAGTLRERKQTTKHFTDGATSTETRGKQAVCGSIQCPSAELHPGHAEGAAGPGEATGTRQQKAAENAPRPCWGAGVTWMSPWMSGLGCPTALDAGAGSGCVSFPRGRILHRGRAQSSGQFSEKCSKCVTLRVPALTLNPSICTWQRNQKAFPKIPERRNQLTAAAFLCPQTSSSRLCRGDEHRPVGREGTEHSGQESHSFCPLYEGDCTLCLSFSVGGDGSCPSRAPGPLKLHFAHFPRAGFLPKGGTGRVLGLLSPRSPCRRSRARSRPGLSPEGAPNPGKASPAGRAGEQGPWAASPGAFPMHQHHTRTNAEPPLAWGDPHGNFGHVYKRRMPFHQLPGSDGFVTGESPESPCQRKALHPLARSEGSEPDLATGVTFLFTHNSLSTFLFKRGRASLSPPSRSSGLTLSFNS